MCSLRNFITARLRSATLSRNSGEPLALAGLEPELEVELVVAGVFEGAGDLALSFFSAAGLPNIEADNFGMEPSAMLVPKIEVDAFGIVSVVLTELESNIEVVGFGKALSDALLAAGLSPAFEELARKEKVGALGEDVAATSADAFGILARNAKGDAAADVLVAGLPNPAMKQARYKNPDYATDQI